MPTPVAPRCVPTRAGSPAQLEQIPVRIAHGVARFEDRRGLAAPVASPPQRSRARTQNGLVGMGDTAPFQASGSRTEVRRQVRQAASAR